MLGAIIGDTVGSVYEFNNIKTTDFPLFVEESNFTDDSVMTFAVLDWLLRDESHSLQELEQSLVGFANTYPCPIGGYGGSFHKWLFSPEFLPSEKHEGMGSIGSFIKENFLANCNKSKRHPYNSWGNGSAMRVSAVGWMFDTLEETERVAKISAEITHNHPEGIKGAQATAAAIFMARTGKSKEDIKSYIETKYGYDLSKTCDEIRPTYRFDESCQGTVPPALIAFFESTDFESAIRLAVSLGGDSDTLACITGGVAEAFYKEIPAEIKNEMMNRLPNRFKKLLQKLIQKSSYSIDLNFDDFENTNNRITPRHISELQENEVFVFGSNLQGQHVGGAARAAADYFGAIWGQGVGLQGQSYAIPTMQGGPETIKPYVDEFIQFAKDHPELSFLVTPIGCGIAGLKFEEIAPLFADAMRVENISLPKGFWEILDK